MTVGNDQSGRDDRLVEPQTEQRHLRLMSGTWNDGPSRRARSDELRVAPLMQL